MISKWKTFLAANQHKLNWNRVAGKIQPCTILGSEAESCQQMVKKLINKEDCNKLQEAILMAESENVK